MLAVTSDHSRFSPKKPHTLPASITQSSLRIVNPTGKWLLLTSPPVLVSGKSPFRSKLPSHILQEAFPEFLHRTTGLITLRACASQLAFHR